MTNLGLRQPAPGLSAIHPENNILPASKIKFSPILSSLGLLALSLLAIGRGSGPAQSPFKAIQKTTRPSLATKHPANCLEPIRKL